MASPWPTCAALRRLSRGLPVNAVAIGEKLAVIEFHAARGTEVALGISVAAFPFPVGGLHSRAAASTDFKQNQNKQAEGTKDNRNYTPEKAACVAFTRLLSHTRVCRLC